jgi:hypothetical protein
MSCFKLPKWLIHEIDKRRRAFFWKGQKNTSGANCMVAWENVCTSKHEGGLGVKNLEQQNISLLLKFIHKYHTQPDCSWAKWIRNSVYSNQKKDRR